MSKLSNGSMLMKVMDGYEVLCLRGEDNHYQYLDCDEVTGDDKVIERTEQGMNAVELEHVQFDTTLVFRRRNHDGAGSFNLSLKSATPGGERDE